MKLAMLNTQYLEMVMCNATDVIMAILILQVSVLMFGLVATAHHMIA